MKTLLLALLLVQAQTPVRPGNGTVTGKILSMEGTPAAGVRMAAVPVPESSTQPASAPVLSSIAQTDSTGSYRLENIPPGRYYIMAGLVDRPMYFPGVDTTSTATIVNVTALTPVSGIDFRLQRRVSFKVSGRVEGVTFSPLQRPTVVLQPQAPPFFMYRTSLGADATYEIANVPGGSYSVAVIGAEMSDAVTIILADKDLTGVDIALIDPSVNTKQEGLAPIWSLPGLWGAVVQDTQTGVLHASSTRTRTELDATGKVLREVPFPRSATWRLARFSGVSEPVFLSTGFPGIEARTASGNLLWTYPDASVTTSGGPNGAWPLDLDGDQSDEVIIGFNGGTGLHVVNSKGQLVWKSTSIGNVWNVSGGDVYGNGKPRVVTTSATGNVHIFSDDGTSKVDLDLRSYLNMVRVGKVSANDTAATIFAGGSASDNKSAWFAALTSDGMEKWSQVLQAPGRASIYSTHLAPGKPWVAVGMTTGVLYVLDARLGRVVATIDGLGQNPELAWISGKDDADPLLVVSTRTSLTAFRITTAAQ
jgi:hypothetical protein